MTYPDDATNRTWYDRLMASFMKRFRIIFRLPRETYGDVETMRRGLLGLQRFFINPLNMVGLKLSLYPLRQSILRIGLRMLTLTFTYYINLYSLGIIVPIVHFGTWPAR